MNSGISDPGLHDAYDDWGIKPKENSAKAQDLEPVKRAETTPSKPEITSSLKSKIPRAIGAIASLGVLIAAKKYITPLLLLPSLQNQGRMPEFERGLVDSKLRARGGERMSLTTHDGAVVDAAKIPPKSGPSENYIIYFNGNAERYEQGIDILSEMADRTGANVIVFNYRGVGDSKGYPHSASDLVTDGQTVVQHLKDLGIDEKNIVLYARSIGGGVGAQVASRYERIGIVSERSFSSMHREVRKILGDGALGKVAGNLVKAIGWDMDSKKAFNKMKHDKKLVVVHAYDKVIPYDASLAKKMMKQESRLDSPQKLSKADRIKAKLGIKSKTVSNEHKPEILHLKEQYRMNEYESPVSKTEALRNFKALRSIVIPDLKDQLNLLRADPEYKAAQEKRDRLEAELNGLMRAKLAANMSEDYIINDDPDYAKKRTEFERADWDFTGFKSDENALLEKIAAGNQLLEDGFEAYFEKGYKHPVEAHNQPLTTEVQQIFDRMKGMFGK